VTSAALAEALLDALPQTQCRRCGYADCRAYAEAMAAGQAAINRCPPGGAEGIARLARISGKPALALDPSVGHEGPRGLARIDEAWCIGCTLCIKACPVDCIVGAARQMHTVIDADCTGCELCVPACPVDCIAMVPANGTHTGWQAWSAEQAGRASERYAAHRRRLQQAASASPAEAPEGESPDTATDKAATPHEVPGTSGAAGEGRSTNAGAVRPLDAARRQALVAAALARAREARRP
jgi:electron transport complex protein RnfB